MAIKSSSKSRRKSPPVDPFRSAIKAGDVAAVKKLIANGIKPDEDAVESAADLSNKAHAICHQQEKTLFGRKPTPKQIKKAEVESLAGYEMVKTMLGAGAPVPAELCPAANCGNTRLAKLLIKYGADVNYAPPMGTPLENAVGSGEMEILRALIAAGADVNHQGYLGPVLTQVVEKGQLQIAAELIRAGADPSSKPRFGQSPLMKAVEQKRPDFVRLLLACGANVNVKDSARVGDFGEPEIGKGYYHVPNPPYAREATPLIVASRLGYMDIAAQLTAAGAELEAVDADGLSAMAYAAKAGNQEMIKLLSDAGAKSLKYAEGSREAAWIAAAKAGDCERLQQLLKDGVDVNLKHSTTEEPEEGTALTHAAENGKVEAVKCLLKSGARVDERCGSGGEEAKRTALMHAARSGGSDVIPILLGAGASVAAKDRSGLTPMHYAAKSGHDDIIRALAKAGANVEARDKSGSSPLMEAAGEGHADAVRVLLELKADPNAATKDGVTALFGAALDGHAAVVQLLLEKGARVEPVNPMFSPLEVASETGHKSVVTLLLNAKRGKKGPAAKTAPPDHSAVIGAVMSGKVDVVRSLLDAGADPNATMEDTPFTALMTAVRIGNLEVLRMLLAAGARVNAMNEDRKTALDLACEGITIAKDQLRFVKMLGDDDEVGQLLDQLKKGAGEDELTAVLRAAGGKRGKELKGVRPPKPRKPEPEPEGRDVEDLPIPDFARRAKSPEFQKAIQELAELYATKSKNTSNEDGDSLRGCASFRVSTETADKILTAHHEALLKRGFYLVKSDRGFASGKDTLTLLPTDKRAEVFAAFQTNGANSGAYPAVIVRWFDALEKEQPFLLTGVGFDWCEGRFTRPIKDSKKLAKKMYDFCPDIVDQGVGDIARLTLELKKTQKFFFWWD